MSLDMILECIRERNDIVLLPEENAMKCPYCNQEMKTGFINTGRTRMLFSAKDRWDTIVKPDDIVMRKAWRKTVPSFYCENCNIIITQLEKGK